MQQHRDIRLFYKFIGLDLRRIIRQWPSDHALENIMVSRHRVEIGTAKKQLTAQ